MMESIIWSYGILPSLLCYLILELEGSHFVCMGMLVPSLCYLCVWNCAVTSEEVFDFYRKKKKKKVHLGIPPTFYGYFCTTF